ncbi:hypothetical protein FQA39_LY03815 [Lamprigera yunnana]|nr:hypothetical protein FQA39_LY03815 [Lamprigera yunnana]
MDVLRNILQLSASSATVRNDMLRNLYDYVWVMQLRNAALRNNPLRNLFDNVWASLQSNRPPVKAKSWSILPEDVPPNINCEEDVIVKDQNSLEFVEEDALKNKPGSNYLAELGPSQHNEVSLDSYVQPSTSLSEPNSDFYNSEREINVFEPSEIIVPGQEKRAYESYENF